mmetsp:Transcript_107654/g.285324  ORF Transcript_107654/g.285324 Transcript_107654/m.285324 type:complete len:472 (-) Transcript_107654:74-1489(-)
MRCGSGDMGLQWVVFLTYLVASAAPVPAPLTDGLFDFLVTSGFAKPPAGVMLCHFGFSEHTVALSRRILVDLSPPEHRAHVAFLRWPEEAGETLRGLAAEFPERAHVPDEFDPFESLCSVLVLAMEDPRFTAEEIRLVARPTGTVVSHFESPCSGERAYACRFFASTWESLVGASASCGRHFCASMLPAESIEVLEDPLLSSVDCPALRGPDVPLSPASQWQQDWFVYRNFIRGSALDLPADEGRKAERRGVFVDIGAFHPIHLSNTFFFERCLGWHGVCAEPNPNWAPYFNAYRPNCQLVRNCVWSRPRDVTMSFQKDPIEAYIQEDGSSDDSESGAPGVLVEGKGSQHKFTAQCRTLEDILTSAGLRKPAIVDYMSVDAEAAEVEIFRVFPFDEFDIRVINVEVQAKNYYDLDVIFSMANYAKVAVLGGDHVYAKLTRGLKMPDGAAEWHSTLSKDFHAYVKPQTATLQ